MARRILITGANSYIGTSFEKWLNKWPDMYVIDTVDMKSNTWKEKDFSSYDVVFHVAGIAHVSINPKMAELYYKVNRDLAIETATKAKAEGVKQFIFMSTMGVYGVETGSINELTKPNPKTPYAQSKLQAEDLICELVDESFKVAILRPPIVYGKDCKGNYPKLASMALKIPFFPDMNNERSMIYIDNLSEFVRLIIDKGDGGLFFPQNKDYVNTTELVIRIANLHGKELRTIRMFNSLVYLGVKLSETFDKVFGSFVYDKKMSSEPIEFEYETCSFEESIERTER